MSIKKSLESRLRGWLPKEPLLKGHSATAPLKPEVKAALDQELSKKLIKAISITNPIIASVIIASNRSTLIKWNLETVVLTVELMLVLLVANILIYLYLKHQRTVGET
jgi:hypothetical protein